MTRQLPIARGSWADEELALRPPAGLGAPAGPLRDADGRSIRYVRISVTDRCDLRCVYCMPLGGETEHGTRPEILTFEEIARLVRVLAQGGVRRARFTGGEPLLRKDVVELVALVHRFAPEVDLCLTTNGTKLERLAADLFRAGLRRLNVSLDTLDPDRFRETTRGGDLARVIAGFDAAQRAGFDDVALNVVAMRGTNDDEIPALVDWSWARGIEPRFIELMPIGEGAKLAADRQIGWREIAVRLGSRIDLAGVDRPQGRGPAFYVPAADGSGRRVGFITAITESFCETCNRIRVTARGDLRACLASRRAISLRDAMRAGLGDDEILGQVAWALGQKEVGHHFDSTDIDEHERVGMSLIGG